MFRVLLIYAAAMVAFIVAGTIATGAPLEAVAWLVFLVEAVPLATWGGAMLVRRAMRQSNKLRSDVPHLSADPVAPPLAAPWHPHITIEAPERKLIEAPRREVEVSHER